MGDKGKYNGKEREKKGRKLLKIGARMRNKKRENS